MALGTTSISGLISGLDTTSIINALAEAKRKPITLITEHVTAQSKVAQAYDSLTTQLNALRDSADAVTQDSVLQARTTTVSQPTAVLATAGSTTATGSYKLVVDQLATANKVSSGAIADPTAVLGFGGTITLNGKSFALKADASLNDLRDSINQAQAGVAASILTVSDTDHRLVLSSLKTGAANAIEMTASDDGSFVASLGLHDLQAAQDAIVHIDGYTVQRSSNSIDDAVEGLSLDLLTADPDQEIQVNVSQNTQPAVTALENLVTNYNAVMTAINSGQSFDSSSNTGGVLFGQAAVLSLQSGLQQQVLTGLHSLSGSLSALSQIGLSTDRYGMLTLDDSKLQSALRTDPQGVMQLLTTQGQATGVGVEYVSSGTSTADSGSAGYAVNITQAATQATALSDQLASGIQQDETLTINGSYKVALQAGMTLQQAADKLNSVLTGNSVGMKATVVDDRLQLQSNFYGSSYGISIVSSLDDGAGGTGLGGATAGAANTVYGTNVEGTIGGKKAQGWGQWLTGSEGGVTDLKLKITGTETGDCGVVKLSQGLGSRLGNYAAQVTDAKNGLITRAGQAIADDISRQTEDATKMEDSVQDYIAQLQDKYATLEGVIAKNKTTLQYLQAQLGIDTGSSTSSFDTSA